MGFIGKLMNIKSTRTLILYLALAVACSCALQVNAQQIEMPKSTLQIYFGSAVLQLKTDANIIKPVHSIQNARSGEEAEQSFIALINRDFPDYAVLTTLTSPASAIKAPACERQSFAVNI